MNYRLHLTIGFAAVAGLAAICAATASDWPQWRGPMRDGISKEIGLLKSWPTEGPKLLWQVKDLGTGFSTPAIVGNRIYLINNKGMDDEYVQALSTKDGSVIWKTKIGKVGKPDQNPKYPGARSTPTVEGNTVYVMGSDGDLASLDAGTGKINWHKNVQTEFGGQAGIWAYSESPLIDGDAIVCTPGGTQATLLKLNKKTGDVIWKSVSPEGDFAGYASIVKADIGGTPQYVQFVQKGVVGVDVKSGKLLWRFDRTAKNSMANIPTPIVSDGLVYTGTGQGGAGLAKVTGSGSEFQANEVYFSQKLPRAIGGAVKIGDYLYGANNQVLMCIDFKTGELKWEDRCVGPASVLFADGNLYVHGENGDLALVEATPTAYNLKGKFTPPDPPMRGSNKAWTYPVISNGKLYIHDLGVLWCYELKG